VSVKIPAGTHSGQTLRLKGKGFPKPGGFGSGDMRVKVMIDVPQNLTTEQKDLVEKLQKSLGEDPPLVKSYREKLGQLEKNRR
jgi:molecular chaperone DnaJ